MFSARVFHWLLPSHLHSVDSNLPKKLCFLLFHVTLSWVFFFSLLGRGRVSRSVVPDSLWVHGLQPAGLLCPWDSPGKNTGVGGHFILQGIFLAQGSNLALSLGRQILYHLSQILLWHAVPIFYYLGRSDSLFLI